MFNASVASTFVGASSPSKFFPVLFTGSRSSPAKDFRACFRTLFGSEDERFSSSFRSTTSSRFFFSLAFSLANAFSAFLAALAALRSFFHLLRSLRSSFVSALSSDFRFLLFLVSPGTLSCSPTCSCTGVEERDEDEEDDGGTSDVALTRGSSSGPNTGPLKNLEYRPRFAASLLAVARSERRSAATASVSGTLVSAGVPEMGRRLEMMPVVVRRRGSVREEGSWRASVSSVSSSSSLDILIVIVFDAAVNKLRISWVTSMHQEVSRARTGPRRGRPRHGLCLDR